MSNLILLGSPGRSGIWFWSALVTGPNKECHPFSADDLVPKKCVKSVKACSCWNAVFLHLTDVMVYLANMWLMSWFTWLMSLFNLSAFDWCHYLTWPALDWCHCLTWSAKNFISSVHDGSPSTVIHCPSDTMPVLQHYHTISGKQ